MERDNNILGSASVPKLMVKFAVPSIIAMLVNALYNIIDQLFIGNSVGTLGNTATNIVFPISTSCVALALLFGIGGASCFNLTLGKGEKEKASYFVGNGILMLIICGVALMLVTLSFTDPLLTLFGSPKEVMPYAKEYVRVCAFGFPALVLVTGGGHLIRADGSPKMTMFCSLIGAVLNILLDAMFVTGFLTGLHLGMTGAALATIIGQYVSAIIVLVYLKFFKTAKLKIKHFKPDLKVIGKTASIGMAPFVNQLAIMVVQIVLNQYLRLYGGMSEFGESIPIACAGIIMKINMIVFSIIIGLAQGTQPIESYNYGAKKFDRVKQAYWLAIITGGILSVIAFVMFQLFPREIISAFGNGSNEYFKFGVRFFRIFLLLTPLNCIQPVTSTFFTSIGKPIKGAILSLTKNIICFVPALLILPQFFGINGILYAGPIADLLAMIINVILIANEFRAISKEQKKLQAEN